MYKVRNDVQDIRNGREITYNITKSIIATNATCRQSVKRKDTEEKALRNMGEYFGLERGKM